MANKRKSAESKLLSGTLPKSQAGIHVLDLPDDSSVPENAFSEDENQSKSIKKPSILKGEAAKHWRRLLPLMERHGLISNIDSDQLARYCILLARNYEAEAHVIEEGAVILVEIGRTREREGIRPKVGRPKEGDEEPIVKSYQKPSRNPWIGIAKDCSQELRRYERAMKMTNDSNPELHSKRKPVKNAKKKTGPERFFDD